jgi:hypothetical protein
MVSLFSLSGLREEGGSACQHALRESTVKNRRKASLREAAEALGRHVERRIELR